MSHFEGYNQKASLNVLPGLTLLIPKEISKPETKKFVITKKAVYLYHIWYTLKLYYYGSRASNIKRVQR